MAVRSSFFNSVNGDRKYDASKFAEYFNSFIGNGVFPMPTDGLQVVSNDDMTVTVKLGKAWINGYMMTNTDDYILNIDVADGVLNRIDRVVARYGVGERDIWLEVKKGTFASNPVAPALQRDADAYELGIADILVNNGVVSIIQANITDTRDHEELCGKVDSLIAGDVNALMDKVNIINGPGIIKTKANVDDLITTQQDLGTHLAENVYLNEPHGIRVKNKALQIYNNDLDVWFDYNAIKDEFDDKTNSPGSKLLIAGTMDAGYFGVVPASELFTGTEIASACGITQGTAQFNDVGWLKFAIDGKIIFKSQKTYRHSISYNNINSVGCVKGTKQVAKNGNTYKVRLMKGALTDPSADVGGDKGAKGSEWNRLMLPIHIQAKDASWAHPANVESNIPYWGIDFTDVDLQTNTTAGNGSAQWCQEIYGAAPTNQVFRGSGGVSNAGGNAPSTSNTNMGWSPVLEVVE